MIGVRELANVLNVSTDTVRNLVNRGAIPFYNVAPPDSKHRTLRFDADEVRAKLKHEHNGDKKDKATERVDIGGAVS